MGKVELIKDLPDCVEYEKNGELGLAHLDREKGVYVANNREYVESIDSAMARMLQNREVKQEYEREQE
jgi:hypothetical protein